jgi:hypothetical protein
MPGMVLLVSGDVDSEYFFISLEENSKVNRLTSQVGRTYAIQPLCFANGAEGRTWRTRHIIARH